jgi:hypothetical protein
MNSSKDYYGVLSVLPSIEEAPLKAVYISLLKKYHPDVFKGSQKEANRITKELNEAYEILGDPAKRLEYDNLKKFQAAKEDLGNSGLDDDGSIAFSIDVASVESLPNKEMSDGAAMTTRFLFFLLITFFCSYAAYLGYFSESNTYIRIAYYVVYIFSFILMIGSFVSALEAYEYRFWKSGTTYGSQLVMISLFMIPSLNPSDGPIAWVEVQIVLATFASVISIICLILNIGKTNLIFGLMLTVVQVFFIIPFAIATFAMVSVLKTLITGGKNPK